jgi:SAM-dependent methyltransferase
MYTLDRRGGEESRIVRSFYDDLFAQGWLDGWQDNCPPNSNPNYLHPWRLLGLGPGVGRTPKPRVLDVGCGSGGFISVVSNEASGFGIDLSFSALKYGRTKLRNVGFAQASATSLPFRDSSFDIVTCIGSLEHFPDMELALLEMRRVLTEDGRILIHVPNLMSSQTMLRYMISRKGPSSDQILERYALQGDWQELFEKCGLHVMSFSGYNYPLRLRDHTSSLRQFVSAALRKALETCSPDHMKLLFNYVLVKHE